MQKFPISIGERRRRGAGMQTVINFILIILVAVLVLEVVFFSRFKRFYIVGASMYPTLVGAEQPDEAGGDYVYADTAAEAQRWDIVVINALDRWTNERTTIIKRVIAFEGEEVELVRGKLYIDGEEIDEPYVDPQNNDPADRYNTMSARVVDEGCVFVLGDNRNVSVDSRDEKKYGMIDEDDIIGVVAEWSLSMRWLINPISTFFDFSLAGCAGK